MGMLLLADARLISPDS